MAEQENNKFTRIKEYLVGTPDRILSFVSVIFGAASIILTVYLWKFPQPIPELIILRDITAFIILILVSGLLLYKYIRRESHLEGLSKNLMTSNNRLYNQFNDFHSIAHKFRNDLFSHYVNRIPQDCLVQEKDLATFEKICHSITMGLKRTFIGYLESKNIQLNNDDLCITVKLTLSSKNILDLYGQAFDKTTKKQLTKNQQFVITVYRDPETYESYREKREVGNRIYSVDKNTAFIHIFQDREDVFSCNNLLSLGKAYKNENANWKERYNATIVAPIRYCAQDDKNYRCFGYIAIDSLNSHNHNLFENDEAKYIVGHTADLMANYFLVLSLGRNIMPTTTSEKI